MLLWPEEMRKPRPRGTRERLICWRETFSVSQGAALSSLWKLCYSQLRISNGCLFVQMRLSVARTRSFSFRLVNQGSLQC